MQISLISIVACLVLGTVAGGREVKRALELSEEEFDEAASCPWYCFGRCWNSKCRSSCSNCAPPSPSPSSAPGWWVRDGFGCRRVKDEREDCIVSNGYPMNYSNGDRCTIGVKGKVEMRVVQFETEFGYDGLRFGQTSWAQNSNFSGHTWPPNGTVSGEIHWSADSDITDRGWKICRSPDHHHPSPDYYPSP